MRVETLMNYRSGRAIAQLAGLLGPARATPARSAAFGGPATAPQPRAFGPLQAALPPVLDPKMPPKPKAKSKKDCAVAQRCGGVAVGQTEGETKCSLKGRADLRAPQHSGGQLAGRGPQNIN